MLGIADVSNYDNSDGLSGIEARIMNKYVLITATIAATAGLLFGFDTGNIAGALIYIQKDLHTSTFQNELIVSITILGAFLSALFSSRLVDYYGRRGILIIAGGLFIIGALSGSIANSITTLVMARFLLGLAIGVSSYAAPLYISEMAPSQSRGQFVLLNGIAITSGEALAYLVDYFFSYNGNWRMMIFAGMIPGLILLMGMIFMPCSPRWLMMSGRSTKAVEVLKKIRGNSPIEAELNEISQVASCPRPTLKMLFAKKVRPLLIIGIGLGVFQQLFGINTIMYYGPFIFHHAGFQSGSSQILATFGMGLVNVIMTLLTGLVVDRWGRRNLLMLGSTLAGVSLLVVSTLFHQTIQAPWQSHLLLFSMMTFIVGYCISVGSLFWLIIAEIYPLQIRSTAMSFATAIQWAANFAVSMTFLTMLTGLGPDWTFGFYASMCFAALIFSYYLVPETKGRTLEEIEMRPFLRKNQIPIT